ncbi:alkaline phosphatase [Terrimonas sp.]|uniref:alkaline phosphatase n=1 Tax=Terrimonas sp. TaxID=1914338 RepID=UPI000D51DD06|nr:alkaline phosphatase [Terrimonas sp.]PVD54090.1 alkaline phosphatase [Terrimonas sp.]
MYKRFSFLIAIGCCFQLCAQPSKIRHVVLIGCDGFGAYAVPHADMPELKKLMQNGAWSLKARAVLPSSSAVNWASILMGAGPTMHGYTEWNSVVPEIPSADTTPGGIFPSVFSLLKMQKPSASTALIFSWQGIDPLVEKGATDFRFAGNNKDDVCVDTAVVVIISQKPVLTFIHLDEPDGVGHNIGHRTKEYYEELKKVDARIGRIVAVVTEAGIADETVIIVTADHGGIHKGHGGKSLDEVLIPWILYGRGVKKNKELQTPIITYDTGATIAWLLGLKMPASWRGLPVKEAF